MHRPRQCLDHGVSARGAAAASGSDDRRRFGCPHREGWLFRTCLVALLEHLKQVLKELAKARTLVWLDVCHRARRQVACMGLDERHIGILEELLWEV